MTNFIITNLATTTQIPLDGKLYIKTIAEVLNLGTDNAKAFTYYEDMIITVVENHNTYRWREVVSGDTNGLLPTPFTYPDNVVTDGLVYSNRVFNFFPEEFAVISGDENEVFKVADSVVDADAVNKRQLDIERVRIGTNTTDITTANTNISTNASDIVTANANIATNTTDIGTNTTDIATNSGLILGFVNGAGSQVFDTLAAATVYYNDAGTSPKPIDGFRFYVNKTLDATNAAFIWSFQSAEANRVRQEEAIVVQQDITDALLLKADKTDTGDKALLTTTDKTTIVAGVSEVDTNLKSITTAITTSINLFNVNAPLLFETGYYNNSNAFVSSGSWVTLAPIPVLPNTTYVISPFGNANVASFANGLNAAGTPINNIVIAKTVGVKATITTGMNDVSLAIGMLRTEYTLNSATLQIEQGEDPTVFGPYTSALRINNADVEGFAELTAQVTSLNTLTTTIPSGKNLFDKGGINWLNGGFYSNGNLIVNANFIGLPLVEVAEFTNITITPFQATNTFSFVYCVDAAGNYIADAVLDEIITGTGGTGYGKYRTVRNTKYISLATTIPTFALIKDIIQVELGSVQTSFEEFIPELLVEPSKIKDYQVLSTKVDSVTDIRSNFPSPTYTGISDKFSNFREAVLKKLGDAVVVITATSLGQGTPWASVKPLAEASTRPPLLFTNNFASLLYDELAKLYPSQQHRRYDHAFFTEVGTGFTVAKDDALWDTSTYVEGYTKFSTAANAGVIFTVPADAYSFNFIHRTDSLGDSFTVTVGGVLLMEVFNGTAWVEAHNFTGTMLESVATTTKGNTVYQKRLKMRCKNRYDVGGIDSIGTTKTVTITKGNNTDRRFLFVGVEWSRAEFMLQVINGARGSHNWGTGTLDLSRFQDGDIHIHNPTLILAEITTINWGGSNKSSLLTSPEFYINNTRKWYFNELNPDNPSDTLEPNSLHAKTNGYTTTDVLFFNDTMTGATSNSGPWDIAGDSATLAWGTVTIAGNYLGTIRTCLTAYEVVDEYIRANQPTYAFISTNREFRKVSEATFGGWYEGLLASGPTGGTLLNDAVHYNDNGNALLGAIILPAFKF